MSTVLLIDDHPELLQITGELLEFAGYKVLTAGAGHVGIETARQAHPDVIFCDIQMPHMTGFEIQDQLQFDTVTATIPFVFLTAARPETLPEGTPYLSKPFEASELLDLLQAILE